MMIWSTFHRVISCLVWLLVLHRYQVDSSSIRSNHLLRIQDVKHDHETIHLTLQISTNEEDEETVNLRLVPNDNLFAPNYQYYTHSSDSSSFTSTVSNQLRRCFYHGYSSYSSSPIAALSICNPLSLKDDDSSDNLHHLSGWIRWQGQIRSIQPSYSIHELAASSPLPLKTSSRTHRVSSISSHSSTLASGSDDDIDTTLFHQLSKSISDSHHRFRNEAFVANTTKYIELIVVNDHERYQSLQSTTEYDTAAIVNKAAMLYLNSNSFISHVVITLVSQLTFTTSTPSSLLTTSSSTLLSNFTRFFSLSSNINNIAYDTVHLFSGRKFDAGIVGQSTYSSMCQIGESGGIESMMYGDDMNAIIFSQMLGHNLGMFFDDASAACPVDVHAIMAPTLVDSSCQDNAASCPTYVVSDYHFSSCSVAYFNAFIQLPTTSCLDNVPSTRWGATQICGNGLREGNETCDCGSLDCSTIDNCCNGTTCQLKENAVCSAMDPCCTQSCTAIGKKGNECRAAANSCDIPEVCDGVSSLCPSNIFVVDGSTCVSPYDTTSSPDGMCHAGTCYSYSSQCKLLSSSFFSNTSLHACPILLRNNVTCGPLLCQGVDASSCVNFQVGSFVPQVDDGTPCGVNLNDKRQCLNGACVASSTLNNFQWYTSVWSDCNCATFTQTRVASCSSTPPSSSSPSASSMPTSYPSSCSSSPSLSQTCTCPSSSTSSTMFAIYAVIFVIVVVGIVCVIRYHRRKKSERAKKENLTELNTVKVVEDDEVNDAIKSHRSSKKKNRVKSSHHHAANDEQMMNNKSSATIITEKNKKKKKKSGNTDDGEEGENDAMMMSFSLQPRHQPANSPGPSNPLLSSLSASPLPSSSSTPSSTLVVEDGMEELGIKRIQRLIKTAAGDERVDERQRQREEDAEKEKLRNKIMMGSIKVSNEMTGKLIADDGTDDKKKKKKKKKSKKKDKKSKSEASSSAAASSSSSLLPDLISPPPRSADNDLDDSESDDGEEVRSSKKSPKKEKSPQKIKVTAKHIETPKKEAKPISPSNTSDTITMFGVI